MAVELTTDQLHRLSVDEYRRLVESGAFDEDARVELIDGLLVDMSPKSRAHEQAIEWFTRWLVLHAAVDRSAVRVAAPLTFDTSEPEPDLAVVPFDAPRPNHPATASLVIEIAATSQQRDLVVKPVLYARAGVREYWVLDLQAGELVVHRKPGRDGYATVDRLVAADTVVCDSVDLPPLRLAEPLAAARA